MSKVYASDSMVHGIGVFASVFIRKGEAVLAIDDSRVVTPEAPLRPDQDEHEHHCDYLANGKVVLMQFPERHINHCCDPNTFVRTLLEVRYVFALRDIPPGDEVTYDYCINGGGDVVWPCDCGCERCRKMIHSDFFHLPLALQVEYLPLLDDWFIEERRDKVNWLLRRLLD